MNTVYLEKTEDVLIYPFQLLKNEEGPLYEFLGRRGPEGGIYKDEYKRHLAKIRTAALKRNYDIFIKPQVTLELTIRILDSPRILVNELLEHDWTSLLEDYGVNDDQFKENISNLNNIHFKRYKKTGNEYAMQTELSFRLMRKKVLLFCAEIKNRSQKELNGFYLYAIKPLLEEKV